VTAGETDNDLVDLEVMVNGTSHLCLCDTGSERSIISYRLVSPESIEPCPVKVWAANGVTINTLGLCNVTIQIGDDFQSEFTFIVSKHTNIPVLGMDWMTENATRWDFGAG